MAQYRIQYDSLVYNFPIAEQYQLLGHTFRVHQLSSEEGEQLVPAEKPLMLNYAFISCCYPGEGDVSKYVSLSNDSALVMDLEDPKSAASMGKVMDEVERIVSRIERYMLFMTNMHIFFPVVSIVVFDKDGNKAASCVQCADKPTAFRKWKLEYEKISLSKRTGMHLHYELFEEFLRQRKRYARAYDYYIQSFFETNRASSFCMLCAALDAITGKRNSGMTKKRLAKYSSVLFCNPLYAGMEEEKMREHYKLRSKFVHGKGNSITEEDEFSLREYVRKFLLTYYLFWQELNVEKEDELIAYLDRIYDNHSLYWELVPASYSAMAFLEEHEKREAGVFGLSMQEKHRILVKKILETVFTIPGISNLSNEISPRNI